MQPERGWWKTLFDEVYLQTDARSVCDEQITRKEIDLICGLLPVRPGQRILDLCGGHGRHSLELVSRGYGMCIVVDYSEYLLSRAKKKACESGRRVYCVRADARNTGIRSGMFDHVLIMGNSLGYLSRENADFEIVSEAFRLLRPGGWLLIDVADGEMVVKNFIPRAWHEVEDDMVVCRGREIVGDRICAREMVLSKKDGLIRDRKYAIRLYDRHCLAALFSGCGFESIECHGDFSPHRAKGDYGFMNHRILAVGQKNGRKS